MRHPYAEAWNSEVLLLRKKTPGFLYQETRRLFRM